MGAKTRIILVLAAILCQVTAHTQDKQKLWAPGNQHYVAPEELNSEIYKANIGKIGFSKSPIEVNGNASQLINNFIADQVIHASIFLPTAVPNYRVVPYSAGMVWNVSDRYVPGVIFSSENTDHLLVRAYINDEKNFKKDGPVRPIGGITVNRITLTEANRNKVLFNLVINQQEDGKPYSGGFIRTLDELPEGKHKIQFCVWAGSNYGEYTKNPIATGEITLSKTKRFSPEKISNITISVDTKDPLQFGGRYKLKTKAAITDEVGKRYYTLGTDSELNEKDFDFIVKGGTINDSGVVKISNRLRDCNEGKVTVKAIYKRKAGIDTTLVLDLFTQTEIKTGIYGKDGLWGGNGYYGAGGSNGSAGNGPPLDMCSNGGDGGNGGNANNGADGPDVIVYIKKIKFPNVSELVTVVKSVNVKTSDTVTSYVTDRQKTVTVSAAGGNGGRGGSGGPGGTGGSYTGHSFESSFMCKGGIGGDGGSGGDGGNGGSMKVFIDPNVDQTKFKFLTRGGDGGDGGYAGAGGWGNKPYSQNRNGRAGQKGRHGHDGTPPEITTKKLDDKIFRW